MQAQKWGCAVQQAEAVGSQEQVLCLGVTDGLCRGRLQPARLDVFQWHIEPALLWLAAVNRRDGQDVASLRVYAPQAGATSDHGPRGNCYAWHGDALDFVIQDESHCPTCQDSGFVTA